MTAFQYHDSVAESQRLIDALEQHAAQLPFATEHLAIYRPAHATLEECQRRSDAAVEAWRAALARRWDCEVAGRRLFKQIYGQYVAFYGSEACPEVQRVASTHAEGDGSPAELLADMRRLHADLALHHDDAFLARRAELDRSCDMLEFAIRDAIACEAARRSSVIDRRMAQEALRRVRTTTQHALQSLGGDAVGAELRELLA